MRAGELKMNERSKRRKHRSLSSLDTLVSSLYAALYRNASIGGESLRFINQQSRLLLSTTSLCNLRHTLDTELDLIAPANYASRLFMVLNSRLGLRLTFAQEMQTLAMRNVLSAYPQNQIRWIQSIDMLLHKWAHDELMLAAV